MRGVRQRDFRHGWRRGGGGEAARAEGPREPRHYVLSGRRSFMLTAMAATEGLITLRSGKRSGQWVYCSVQLREVK